MKILAFTRIIQEACFRTRTRRLTFPGEKQSRDRDHCLLFDSHCVTQKVKMQPQQNYRRLPIL